MDEAKLCSCCRNRDLSYCTKNHLFTFFFAVKVKAAVLSVFINNEQVAVSTDFKMTYGGDCISCGLPSGTRFNAVFWENTTSDSENVKAYISNVKITKE